MSDHELFPFDGRRIAWGVIGTLAGVLSIFVAVFYLLFADPEGSARPDRPDYANIRETMRIETEGELNGYGWIDREKGVVRIPLNIAIDKLIEERSAGR